MKISVFTVSTPEYDVDETVALASRIGCDGIEWRVSEPAPGAPPPSSTHENRYWSFNRSTVSVYAMADELPAAAMKTRKAGLEVVAATTYLRVGMASADETVTLVEAAAGAVAASGIPLMRCLLPSYDGKQPYRPLFDQSRATVERLVGVAERTGVRLCFELHMNTIMPSASSAMRLLGGLPAERVGVIYDPGNLVIEGYEDTRIGLEVLGEYLAYVHVKNALWTRTAGPDGPRWKWEWAPVADGAADFARVISVLREAGYDGWLSIEDFSNQEETEPKLTGIVRRLRSLLAGPIGAAS